MINAMDNVIDIGSMNDGPGADLSNFCPYGFIIDDVFCASMEGFLQALKFRNRDIQRQICGLTGYKAKEIGKMENWQRHQRLYWNGFEYPRQSSEYQTLLDRAYLELYKNDDFRKALDNTGNATFTHSIGRSRRSETVLTIEEFCHRLNWLRDIMRGVIEMPVIKPPVIYTIDIDVSELI